MPSLIHHKKAQLAKKVTAFGYSYYDGSSYLGYFLAVKDMREGA